MFKRSCLVLASLLLAGPALATGPAAPAWIVGLCQSHEAQAKEDFLRQVAGVAAQWTERTGFETCGVLGRQDDGRWSLVLSTNRSQVQCQFHDTLLLPNALATPDQLHTHPAAGPDGIIEVLPDTRAHARIAGDRGLDGVTHIRLPDPLRLSSTDLQVGGGYLAAGGRLFHQRSTDARTQDLGALPDVSNQSVCQLKR